LAEKQDSHDSEPAKMFHVEELSMGGTAYDFSASYGLILKRSELG
jgi:hypothetical protein